MRPHSVPLSPPGASVPSDGPFVASSFCAVRVSTLPSSTTAATCVRARERSTAAPIPELLRMIPPESSLQVQPTPQELGHLASREVPTRQSSLDFLIPSPARESAVLSGASPLPPSPLPHPSPWPRHPLAY